MLNNPSFDQLAKDELKSDALKRGIPTEAPVSHPLSENERSSFEKQLSQVREILSLGFSSPEFVNSAISQNKSPETYYEYLSRREAELSNQLNSGQYYYSLPTNEFLDYVINRYATSQYETESLKRENVQTTKHFKISLAVIAILLCLSLFLFATRFTDQSSSPQSKDMTPSNETGSMSSDNSMESYDETSGNNMDVNDEDQLETLPYPENGTILVDSGLNRVAPLEIKTDEGLAYYVKLCDMNNNEVIGFFVGPNASVEVSVPLGTYELRYACGTAWYGTTPKFGSDTQYYKADMLFDFTDDGTYYNGHTVTLYAVPGGNLNTEEIDSSEF